MEIVVGIIAGLIALAGLAFIGTSKVSKSGEIKEKNKSLEAEVEGNAEFQKRGEEWDDFGGLLDAADDRLPKSASKDQ